MAERLTQPAREEAYAPHSKAAWLMCVTIDHPGIEDGPLRVVNDNKDLVRIVDGQEVTFTAYPFQIDLPPDDEEGQGRTPVTIWDPAGTITATVRGLRPAPEAMLELVVSKDPNTVERGPILLVLKERESSDGEINAEFGIEDILDHRAQDDTMSPGKLPGIFA